MRRQDIAEIQRMLDELYERRAEVPGDEIERYAETRDVSDDVKEFFRTLPRGISYRKRELVTRVDQMVLERSKAGALQ